MRVPGLPAALLLGCLWPLAFAPFAQWYLAPLLLAAIFGMAVQAPSAKYAALLGYLFGFGAFAAGIYWVAIPLHRYAHMSWGLAAIPTALLAGYCALYPALALGISRRFFSIRSRWLVVPILWILGEYLRARVATGFPWLATGYSQTGTTLGGYASWIGQYGVGLMVAGIASTLAWMYQHRHNMRWVAAGIIGILSVFGGGWLAGEASFTQPIGTPLKVRLLQGDIPTTEKWNPNQVDGILTRYIHLITATKKGVQLELLPETAFPVFQTEISGLIARLKVWSSLHATTLMIGIPEYLHHHYYNAAMEIDGLAPIQWYRKQHLVPFGEYIPFPHLLGPLVHHFLPGLGSFTPGHGSSVLPVDGRKAGMSICYEESFSRDIRKGATQGATILINISDYGWFGHSIAAAQTLQMAAMQALESQKPDLRSTNTGITAIINWKGRVVAKIPQFSVAALDGKVQPRSGITLFEALGNIPYLFITFSMLLSELIWQRKKTGH